LLLLVGGIVGCITQKDKTNTIANQNNPPTCYLSANLLSGYRPLNVTFSISANDTDGYIFFWKLDVDNDELAEFWGQGNPPPIIQYTYQKLGIYTATLTVNDNNGSTASREVTITIKNHPPTASVTATPLTGEAPLTVHFTGSGDDIDGAIISYFWLFDDGKTSNEKDPIHTYYSEGTYEVKLIVTDNDGKDNFTTVTIVVLPESKESYKASCRTDISFEELNTDPYSYKKERITYKGQVVQVIKEYGKTDYRVDVGDSDIIYVTISGYPDIIEDDYVQIWGEVEGTYTYESIAGWKITLPYIEAKYIEKVSFNMEIGETAEWTDLEVTIKSATKTDYYTWKGYSGDIYYEYADPGKAFVIIDVKVKYTGTSSEYVYGGNFWLVDLGGNKYDYDSATYSLEKGLESTTLYQGQKVEGKILFEIPDDAKGLKVQFNLGTSWNPLLAEWNLNL
ncbi:MAG TPA: DUF4352 domain-containing protein, partial [Candidatus Atribacteria bacterium]|nr:DUF4352 domain-containing protein [Candidatus Atribacteria bacterium]